MWRSFWRSIDRFSIQHFKHVIDELQGIKVVHRHNRELVMDLLQSIVEIVTYGDRQDPYIFECFMEHQVLAEFVRILKISKNSKIEAPLLQYLSILIQNMDSEHAIYYCFSNGYINSIITHPYEFDRGDLALYYVSFLRVVSYKVNRDTLCLLVKFQKATVFLAYPVGDLILTYQASHPHMMLFWLRMTSGFSVCLHPPQDAVISFPLYTEALRFAHHEEKMIQTAIRSLSLNIYNVSDDMVYQFITTPPVSDYFSVLVNRLRDLCFHLDPILHPIGEMDIENKKNRLTPESEKLVDDLYYFKDILSVGKPRLNRLVTENLLNGLVFPILLSLLGSKKKNGSDLSAITSLYFLSRLLQVVGGRSVINNVAGVIIYTYMTSNVRYPSEGNTSHGNDDANLFPIYLNEVERVIGCASESQGTDKINGNYFSAHLEDIMSSSSGDICFKRSGILAYVFSDNHSLLLASLFLLLILAESEDLDCSLAPMIGSNGRDMMLQIDASTSKLEDGSIFVRFMPEIINALLKVLAFQHSLSAKILWHTGWCLQKLLILCRDGLHGDNLLLFNTSYDQSCECFRKELDGIWFDHIPDTVRNEWESCKRALQESSKYKDPLFMLELVIHQDSTNGETTSYIAWQRMVNTVKAFVLHIQLKTFILKGVLVEKPLVNMIGSCPNDSRKVHASDVSSASFGCDVSLESGIPCRISFSTSEIRDTYLIPVVNGIIGKLLLTEKHPFRSRRGVVIAIAPLAGSSPEIDKDYPSWLHLRIRDFDPWFYKTKGRGSHLNPSDHVADGRWTLGFPNAKACEAAQLTIMNEIAKQRSAVENILASLFQNDYLGLAESRSDQSCDQ